MAKMSRKSVKRVSEKRLFKALWVFCLTGLSAKNMQDTDLVKLQSVVASTARKLADTEADYSETESTKDSAEYEYEYIDEGEDENDKYLEEKYGKEFAEEYQREKLMSQKCRKASKNSKCKGKNDKDSSKDKKEGEKPKEKGDYTTLSPGNEKPEEGVDEVYTTAVPVDEVDSTAVDPLRRKLQKKPKGDEKEVSTREKEGGVTGFEFEKEGKAGDEQVYMYDKDEVYTTDAETGEKKKKQKGDKKESYNVTGENKKAKEGKKDGEKPKEGDKEKPKEGEEPKDSEKPKDGEKPEGKKPKEGEEKPEGEKPKEGEEKPEGEKPKEGEEKPEGEKPEEEAPKPEEAEAPVTGGDRARESNSGNTDSEFEAKEPSTTEAEEKTSTNEESKTTIDEKKSETEEKKPTEKSDEGKYSSKDSKKDGEKNGSDKKGSSKSSKSSKGKKKSLSCKAVSKKDDLMYKEGDEYNCLTKEEWSAEKKVWCCENKTLGCPPTESVTTVAPSGTYEDPSVNAESKDPADGAMQDDTYNVGNDIVSVNKEKTKEESFVEKMALQKNMTTTEYLESMNKSMNLNCTRLEKRNEAMQKALGEVSEKKKNKKQKRPSKEKRSQKLSEIDPELLEDEDATVVKQEISFVLSEDHTLLKNDTGIDIMINKFDNALFSSMGMEESDKEYEKIHVFGLDEDSESAPTEGESDSNTVVRRKLSATKRVRINYMISLRSASKNIAKRVQQTQKFAEANSAEQVSLKNNLNELLKDDSSTTLRKRMLRKLSESDISLVVTEPAQISVDEADAEITATNLYATSEGSLESEDLGLMFSEDEEEEETSSTDEASSEVESPSDEPSEFKNDVEVRPVTSAPIDNTANKQNQPTEDPSLQIEALPAEESSSDGGESAPEASGASFARSEEDDDPKEDTDGDNSSNAYQLTFTSISLLVFAYVSAECLPFVQMLLL